MERSSLLSKSQLYSVLAILSIATSGLFLSVPPVTFASAGLYSASSPVKFLVEKEFRQKVSKVSGIWLVEFFADWCGHCQQFAPEFEKSAKALKDIVNVAAVDDKVLMSEFGVTGYPTVKLLISKGSGKPDIVDFKSNRTARDVVDFVLSQLKTIAIARLTGKPGKTSTPSKSDVVTLSDKNFDTELMKDERNAWFVKFYAPWCGHCKALAPDWESLATEVKGKVKIAKVDATTSTMLAKRFSIQGFPTLLMFPVGEKFITSAVVYEGPRSKSELVSHVLQHARSIEPIQLVNEEMFREGCGGNNICVIVFLPHVIDSKAEGRRQYLKDLALFAKTPSPVPVTYFWSQGGDQLELEEHLNLAFGYPAVVALSLGKNSYSVHRGDFTQASVKGFLRMSGHVVDPLPKNIQKIATVDKWDGKDFVAPPEEDLDLDNLDEKKTEL